MTSYGNCILYRNNRNGTFTDVTDKAGVKTPGWTTSAVWFDYDNDGKLDLFVCSYVDYSSKEHFKCGDEKTTLNYYCPPRIFYGTLSFLYHNNGDGTFTEVRKGTDMERSLGKGLGVVAADLNNDGLMDLFVANDTAPNFLYMNRGPEKRAVAIRRDRPPRRSRLQQGRRRRAPEWALTRPTFSVPGIRICSSPTSTRKPTRSTAI